MRNSFNVDDSAYVAAYESAKQWKVCNFVGGFWDGHSMMVADWEGDRKALECGPMNRRVMYHRMYPTTFYFVGYA